MHVNIFGIFHVKSIQIFGKLCNDCLQKTWLKELAKLSDADFNQEYENLKISYKINDKLDVLIKFNKKGNKQSIYYFEQGTQFIQNDTSKFFNSDLFEQKDSKNKNYYSSRQTYLRKECHCCDKEISESCICDQINIEMNSKYLFMYCKTHITYLCLS